MCKKQTSVSHSSTESEIISLDAGLRMDGLPPLDLWDVVIEVLHSSENTHAHTHIKQWETAVEKKRSTIKYRETEYPEKSGAQIPKPC